MDVMMGLFALLTIPAGIFFEKITKRVLNKYRRGDEIVPFFITTLRFTYIFVSISFALEALGYDASKIFLGTTGIMAMIIGFGFKDFLSNIAAGLWIIIVDPFDVGDKVIIAGKEGIIREITSLSVVLETDNGDTIFIPNTSAWGSTIVVKKK